MTDQRNTPALHTEEVCVLGLDIVQDIENLRRLRWGSKRIARELGVARNTVLRYLRNAHARVQKRPGAARLTATQREQAVDLFETTAQGNAVVVHELLVDNGVQASLRTVQRAVAPRRRERARREATTVRFETAPGAQLQVDFGERRVVIGGTEQTVYFFVAALGYSRRLFVRAGLSQRQDEWKLGLEGALQHFGGRPQVVVVDNARALILQHTPGQVRVHPAFEAYCRDRDLAVFACQPYRARTKGKVESGVKYVKRNAIAGRSFTSFAALQEHLAQWLVQADRRVHGTTHDRPIDRFQAAERQALRPLHNPDLAVTTQRLQRKVASDCYVDVDTVRYSVPHRLAREAVEVTMTQTEIVIWRGKVEVARHRRSHERNAVITTIAHFEGIARKAFSPPTESGALASFGASLAVYGNVVGGAP
jgi:transposase